MLDVIAAQLEEVPADFFLDELSRGNFLATSLKRLGRIIDGGGVGEALRGRAAGLLEGASARFRWDIAPRKRPAGGSALVPDTGDDSDDDPPVIVELPE